MTNKLNNPDLNFDTLTLRETRYPRNDAATRLDDGIVDTVAIDRVIGGDQTVPLSMREMICAVHILATKHGETDVEIAERLDWTRDGVFALRKRNGIESLRDPTQGAVLPPTMNFRGEVIRRGSSSRTAGGWRRTPLNQPTPMLPGMGLTLERPGVRAA